MDDSRRLESEPTRPTRAGRGCMVAFSVPFVAVGLIVLGFSFRHAYAALVALRHWQPAEATVLAKEVRRSSGGRGGAYLSGRLRGAAV